jgi:hypothetical protein
LAIGEPADAARRRDRSTATAGVDDGPVISPGRHFFIASVLLCSAVRQYRQRTKKMCMARAAPQHRRYAVKILPFRFFRAAIHEKYLSASRLSTELDAAKN